MCSTNDKKLWTIKTLKVRLFPKEEPDFFTHIFSYSVSLKKFKLRLRDLRKYAIQRITKTPQQ